MVVGNRSEAFNSLYRVGRAAWPHVPLDPTLFAERLLEAFNPTVDVERGLKAFEAADFYVATAAAHGVVEAIAAVVPIIDTAARPAMRRILKDRTALDEAMQRLRRKLLTAEDGAPRIAEYSGRGPLGAWVRATATRLALDLQRAHKRRLDDVDISIGNMPALDESPELAMLKREHGPMFENALRAALASLESPQRNALRLTTVDNLSTAEIGKLYGVNKSTVSRWIAGARQHVQKHVRRTLSNQLHLSGKSVDGYIDDWGEVLDASINSLLKVSRD